MHLTVMNISWVHNKSSVKIMLGINADAVLIAVVIDPIFFTQRASKSFCCNRFEFSSHPSGRRSALISLFSSRVLRCYGTGTGVESII